MESPGPTKILLVDDTPANLVTLEAVLDPLPYTIIKAHSGSEALDILKTTDISLIILDIQMPLMDGFETAKLIKEKFPGKEIPIIFMTAIYKEEPYVQRGFEMGAVAYFGKPFDPAVLKAKVRLYTEMHRQSKLFQSMEKRIMALQLEKYALLDSILDIFCLTSLDGTMVLLNRAFEEQTGHLPEEWIGKHFSSILQPGDVSSSRRLIDETFKEQKGRIFEAGISERSGGYLPVEIHLQPFVPDQKIQGVTCLAHLMSGDKVKKANGRLPAFSRS